MIESHHEPRLQPDRRCDSLHRSDSSRILGSKVGKKIRRR
jgi:hypothetical protein